MGTINRATPQEHKMLYPEWMTKEDIEEFRREMEAIRAEEEEQYWAEQFAAMDETLEV